MPTEEVTATPVEQQQTAFQKWAADPEPKISADAPAPAETEEEAAPEPDKKKPVDPDDQFEALPRWARKEIRKLREKLQARAASETAEEVPEPAAPIPAAKTEEPADRPKRPAVMEFATWEDYETALDKYQESLADWKVQQSRAEERKAAEAQRKQAIETEERAAWGKQLNAAKKEYEDFDEVAHDPDLPITDSMFYVIRNSDNGAKLLYHLGQHPELAASLSAMAPAKAALALGKLEASLFPDEASTGNAKPAAAVTKAPRPPKPITGTTSAEDLEREPDPKDFGKWSKWKDRQERMARER